MLEPKAEVDGEETRPHPPWLWLWPALGQDGSKDREIDCPLFVVINFHTPLMASRKGGSGI